MSLFERMSHDQQRMIVYMVIWKMEIADQKLGTLLMTGKRGSAEAKDVEATYHMWNSVRMTMRQIIGIRRFAEMKDELFGTLPPSFEIHHMRDIEGCEISWNMDGFAECDVCEGAGLSASCENMHHIGEYDGAYDDSDWHEEDDHYPYDSTY